MILYYFFSNLFEITLKNLEPDAESRVRKLFLCEKKTRASLL